MRKSASSRVRVQNVKRVARRHGHLVVRHQGKDYVLVPLEDVERLEDEVDARDAKRISSRIRRGLEKTRAYDEARRDLGLASATIA
jgi:PHD/YefM family antitoxin component YafN of YafNO toxin-antitoxin module